MPRRCCSGTRNGYRAWGEEVRLPEQQRLGIAAYVVPCPPRREHQLRRQFLPPDRLPEGGETLNAVFRPVAAMIAELIAPIEMPATRLAKRAMRQSFAVYASAELMKVLPEPEASVRRAQPVVRSARARGGCPAHGGRVRPAACSFCISLRSAWSLHHSNMPELSPGWRHM